MKGKIVEVKIGEAATANALSFNVLMHFHELSAPVLASLCETRRDRLRHDTRTDERRDVFNGVKRSGTDDGLALFNKRREFVVRVVEDQTVEAAAVDPRRIRPRLLDIARENRELPQVPRRRFDDVVALIVELEGGSEAQLPQGLRLHRHRLNVGVRHGSIRDEADRQFLHVGTVNRQELPVDDRRLVFQS